jgi:hypothetical protein
LISTSQSISETILGDLTQNNTKWSESCPKSGTKNGFGTGLRVFQMKTRHGIITFGWNPWFSLGLSAAECLPLSHLVSASLYPPQYIRIDLHVFPRWMSTAVTVYLPLYIHHYVFESAIVYPLLNVRRWISTSASLYICPIISTSVYLLLYPPLGCFCHPARSSLCIWIGVCCCVSFSYCASELGTAYQPLNLPLSFDYHGLTALYLDRPLYIRRYVSAAVHLDLPLYTIGKNQFTLGYYAQNVELHPFNEIHTFCSDH